MKLDNLGAIVLAVSAIVSCVPESGLRDPDGSAGSAATGGAGGSAGVGTGGATGGTAGGAGTGGTGGSAGAGATGGTAGASGADGSSGTGGGGSGGADATGGASATGGTAGASTGGVAGSSGASASGGTAGTGGGSASGGTSGASGGGGASGTAGTSGADGSSGTAGTSGAGGSSGTSGAGGSSGTAGTSGADGSSGTSGGGGSSGTSGTSGAGGSSGTAGAGGAGGCGAANWQSGLVSYWKLDEATGTRVDSVGTNHLSAVNSVGAATGKIGQGASFASSSGHDLTTVDNPALSTGNVDFTIAAWVKMSTTNFNPFVTKEGPPVGYSVEYELGYDGTRFHLSMSNHATANWRVLANGFGAASGGVWYFVVGWQDSGAGTLNIQVNGGTVDSAISGGVPVDTQEAFHVGRSTSNAVSMDGLIDEVGFWKRVLTPCERTELYNAGAGQTVALTPPSCATSGPGRTDCGPSADESCCASPLVPGGTFYRSYDAVTYTDQSYPATVSDFRLDKYEVTVGRFRKFVSDWVGGWRPAAGAGKHTHLNGGQGLSAPSGGSYESGWDTTWASNLGAAPNLSSCDDGPSYQTWTATAGTNEQRPQTCANWYESLAFCIWDGGFLPSEAEWNYAAAGGSEQRVYPWSNPANSTNIGCTNASYGCLTNTCGDGVSGCGLADLIFVGTKPAGNGRWGQADLGGNVYEWLQDWFTSPYAAGTCDDCAQITASSQRVVRGGKTADVASVLLASDRAGGVGLLPTIRGLVGPRCARVPFATPPSCATSGPGRTDCGPSADESCCTSPLVTGGTFYRSYDGVTSGNTSQAYPATLSDFRLDKYEVTVGRFRKFVSDWVGGWRPAAGAGKHTHLNSGQGLSAPGGGSFESGWDTTWSTNLGGTQSAWTTNLSLACDAAAPVSWTATAGTNEQRPQTCANWYESLAFCIWDGGFLPSEAEWNYAAAGGSEQRVYPWSNPANSTNIGCTNASYGCLTNTCGDGVSGCGLADLIFVGTKPAGNGRWGQADLGGNLHEWMQDWWTSPYAAGTCDDCAQITATANRGIRGGKLDDIEARLLASDRDFASLQPTIRGSVGTRCARSAP